MNDGEHKQRKLSSVIITQVELCKHGVLKHGEYSEKKKEFVAERERESFSI